MEDFSRKMPVHDQIRLSLVFYICLFALPNTPVTVQKVMYWLLALAIIYVLASLLALAFSNKLLAVVTAIPARVFLFFILLVSVALALRTIRWCYLIRQTGLSVRWRDAAQIYVGGFPMALTRDGLANCGGRGCWHQMENRLSARLAVGFL